MKHSHPHPPHAIAAAATLASCLFATSAGAQKYREGDTPIPATMAPELTGVDIVEHLDGQLPRDAIFKDSGGKMVKLGDFFDGKRPTLFVFAYHTCPMLCSLVLDATIKSLNDVNWTVGDEFDVVSLSIDPRDTPESATRKRDQVVASYKRAKGDPRGFHFLVGDETNIRKVTGAVGFEYRYDERQKQYAHPAAIYLLSPEGRVERYLYGISYEPGEVRLGLLEATQGRSISTTERILLYCYHYDPQQKRYTLIAMRVMRLGGVATLAAFGSFLAVMWARERRKKKATDGASIERVGGARPADGTPREASAPATTAESTRGSDPAAGAHSS